jgi:uncharacterized protein (DUF58 family)
MTKPTPRGAALLAVAAATYVAARILGTWELYVVALAFAAMVGVSWGLVAAGSRRLQVSRGVAPSAPVAGDLLLFSFRVRSGSSLPGLQITLHDAVGTLAGSDRSVEFESLGARSTRAVTSGPWPALRGVHRLPVMLAVVEDPLGLVSTRRRVGEELRVTVAPRLPELSSCAPCVDSGMRHGGGRRRLPTLDASEFRGIRPHEPGEPLNRVDWKSTAKTGNLMLREMEAATDDDVTLLLNGAAADVAGELPDTTFEIAVRAAGAMAAYSLRSGHSVNLLLPENGWRPVRLSPNAKSLRRLLGALAGTAPNGLTSLGPSLRAIVADRRPNARSRVVTLVVLKLDEGLVNALVRVRASGLPVSVVHVVDEPAATLSAARDQRRSLTAAGIHYVPVGRADDLPAALSEGSMSRPALVR